MWSSHPDELLIEWDLLLELYEAGRLVKLVPCLIGDLMNTNFIKTQERSSCPPVNQYPFCVFICTLVDFVGLLIFYDLKLGRVMSKLGLVSLDENSVVARVREIFKFADTDRCDFLISPLLPIMPSLSLPIMPSLSATCKTAINVDSCRSRGVGDEPCFLWE